MPVRHTRTSVTGKAAHTPGSPAREDSRKAKGIIRMNPLSREIMWAGSGVLVEVKNTDTTTLHPAKIQPVK